jgi:GNAT superfamily N-acetyltransferase
MVARKAELSDRDAVLNLLDEFRADCIEQITGKPGESKSARTGGLKIFEKLLSRSDYCVLLLVDESSASVGIITGYLCPMLRNGEMRAEVEEFFIKKNYRGKDNAKLLMNAFITWCQSHNVKKVNLESEIGLIRAQAFYKKYGFETKAQRFIKKLE